MNVILLEKIRNLGDLGDQVNVKSGYGRNYLIPEGKAVAATKANVESFEARRSELEKKAGEALSSAKTRAEAIKQLSILIAAKTGDEGKLYGSVGTREIAEAITSQGVEIQKSEISLPSGAIRFAGEYEVNLQLHSDVVVVAKVNVIPE